MSILFLNASYFSTICSIAVASQSNPIISLVFLLSTFLAFSGVLMLLGVDFFTFVVLMVYMGAVAILFLFVIMLLKIKIQEISLWYLSNAIKWFARIITGIFWATVFRNILSNCFSNEFYSFTTVGRVISSIIDPISTITIFGQTFYSLSHLLVILAGLILFVALVGAIVLTIDVRLDPLTQKQSPSRQAARVLFFSLSYFSRHIYF